MKMKIRHVLDVTPSTIIPILEKELEKRGFLIIIRKGKSEVQFNSVLKITAKEVPLPYTREELEQKLSDLVEFIEGEIGELLNKWERELGRPMQDERISGTAYIVKFKNGRKYIRIVQLENIVIFFNPKFTLS